MGVLVTTLTTGVAVAAETVGTTSYQLVKLAAGSTGITVPIDATSGVPAGASVGLVVNVKPGVSVSAQVSGTVSISGALSGNTTTAAPAANATGDIVRVAGSVPVVVSGTITVAGGSITVVTQLGTAVVSVVPGLSVSAQVSGTVSVSGTVAVTMNTLATVLTILGTQVVSVVPGLSVSAQVSGTITINPTILTVNTAPTVAGASVTVQAGVSVTVVTQLGTQVVTVVPGVSVVAQVSGTITVSNVVSVTGTSLNVVASGTVTVSNGTTVVSGTITVISGASVSAQVSGTVSYIPVYRTTTSPPVAATGAVVWLAGGQNPSGQPVLTYDVSHTPVVFMVSSTVAGQNTTMAFTVYTGGTLVVAGTTAYPVPAGRNLRINQVGVIAQSSAVLSGAQFVVLLGTATASMSITTTVGIAAMVPFAIAAAPGQYIAHPLAADVVAGTSVGLGVLGGTSCSVLGAVVQGYLYP